MKKVVSMILAIALIATLSIATLAEGTTGDNTETNNGKAATSIKVNGTYVAGNASDAVISADITWGAMSFTYTDESEETWNPGTHEYNPGTPAGWTCAEGANVITVTNHSNVGITASFSFTRASNEISVSGNFTTSSLSLDSAVGTEYDTAPSDSTTFNITDGNIITDTTLGTISVTIAKADTSTQG